MICKSEYVCVREYVCNCACESVCVYVSVCACVGSSQLTLFFISNFQFVMFIVQLDFEMPC